MAASPRFVILSGEKRRMWDNEYQNSCDLSPRSRRSRRLHSSFLFRVELSQTIKGRYASWAAPEPDNPSHKTLTNSAYPRRSFYAIIVHSLTQMMKSSIKSSFIAYQTEISFDLPLKIPQFAPLMKGQSRKGIDTRLLDRAISNLY